MSTSQKAEDTPWKYFTQDNFRHTTMEFGTCVPDRPLCKVSKTKPERWLYLTEGVNTYMYDNDKIHGGLVRNHPILITILVFNVEGFIK